MGLQKKSDSSSQNSLLSKVKIKYETEKYICVKTNKVDKFNKK